MNSREARLQAKVQEQEGELRRLRQEIQSLRHKIDLLSRRLFDYSSEKLSPGQLQLLLELAVAEEEPRSVEPADPEPAVALPRSRKDRKPRLPDKAWP